MIDYRSLSPALEDGVPAILTILTNCTRKVERRNGNYGCMVMAFNIKYYFIQSV